MKLVECEKLNQKYQELITMVQESLEITLYEQKEKSKRNKFFLEYKKRVYDEIHKLKHQLHIKDKIIEEYNEQLLALKKENFMLKNKFKHLSEIFKSNKELELLNKYFPDKMDLEYKLAKLVKKVLNEKFNPKEVNVLYFRKYFYKIFNQYLIKYVKSIVESEKLSIVIAQIINQEYSKFIDKILAKSILDKVDIKEYEAFIETLIKKDLVEKEKIYKHLEVKYSLDDIIRIVRNFKLLNQEEHIESISFEIELQEIIEKKQQLIQRKEELNEELEQLQKQEDEILAEIVTNGDSDNNEEYKEKLDEIDEEQRKIRDEISFIENEITKLLNRELFIEPLVEVELKKQTKSDKKAIDEYNKLIDTFAIAFKDLR